MDRPVRLFISYASKDEPLKGDLEDHLSTLKRSGLVKTWDSGKIPAGNDRQVEIEEKLGRADCVLLLISATYLASPHYDTVLSYVTQREQEQSAKVIPILIRASAWTKDERLGKLQPLPRDGLPIKSAPDPDEAWTKVVEEVGQIIERFHPGSSTASPAMPTTSAITKQAVPKSEVARLQEEVVALRAEIQRMQSGLASLEKMPTGQQLHPDTGMQRVKKHIKEGERLLENGSSSSYKPWHLQTLSSLAEALGAEHIITHQFAMCSAEPLLKRAEEQLQILQAADSILSEQARERRENSEGLARAIAEGLRTDDDRYPSW